MAFLSRRFGDCVLVHCFGVDAVSKPVNGGSTWWLVLPPQLLMSIGPGFVFVPMNGTGIAAKIRHRLRRSQHRAATQWRFGCCAVEHHLHISGRISSGASSNNPARNFHNASYYQGAACFTGRALAICAIFMLIHSKVVPLVKPLFPAFGVADGVTHRSQRQPGRTHILTHRRSLWAGRPRPGHAPARIALGGGVVTGATRRGRRVGARTGVAGRTRPAQARHFRHPRFVPRDGCGLRGVLGASSRAVVRHGSEAARR